MNETIDIYCDGACRGNNSNIDNIGAYAYLLQYGTKEKLGGEAVRNTTNNQMELMSLIEALKQLKPIARDIPIHVYSDSQYVVKGLTEWWSGWEKKGFVALKNKELWFELKSLWDKYPYIQISWVRGHQETNSGNDKVDTYCNKLMDEVK